MLERLLEFFHQLDIETLVLDYVVGSREAENMWKELGFHPVLTIATASLDDVKRRVDRAGE
jgi:hypothetical protein